MPAIATAVQVSAFTPASAESEASLQSLTSFGSGLRRYSAAAAWCCSTTTFGQPICAIRGCWGDWAVVMPVIRPADAQLPSIVVDWLACHC
jgi:hypothetical protein